MKLKKISILLLFISLFFITPQLVGAVYNGEGSTTNSNPGGGACPVEEKYIDKYCSYNNGDNKHYTVKISLYYFKDDGSKIKKGDSVYLTSSKHDATIGGILKIDNLTEIKDFTWESTRSYFEDMTEEEFTDFIEEKLDVDFDSLTLDHENACGGSYGYRIVAEPVLSVFKLETIDKDGNGKGKYYLKTIKEIAKKNLTNSNRWISDKYSIALYTNCEDVGISAVASEGTTPTAIKDVSIIGSETSGYGYNIIDPTFLPEDKPEDKCYKSVISGSPAFCINDGKVNLGNFDETMEEETCNENSVTTNTEYGRLALSTSTYQVYCTESAEQFFPGNVTEQIQVGTHLVWPKKDAKNDFMKIRGVKSCTIVGTTDDSTKNTIKNTLLSTYMNEFKHDVIIKWDDGSYTKSSVTPYGGVNKSSSVSGNYITLKIDINYSLPENFNRYIDKTTGKVVSTKPSHSNYIDIGYGNLSVSPKASEFGIYELNIINNKLGSNDIFGELVRNYQNYTCYYEVKIPQNCECPEDSEYPGKDLNDEVGDGTTCAEAQQKYCNICIGEDCDCGCPIGTPGYDDPDYKDLKDEMERYHLTCEQAKSFCGSPNACGCPRNTPGYNNHEYRDLRDEMARERISCEQAVSKYCYEQDVCVTCPNWTLQKGKSIYCRNGDCELTKSTLCNKDFLSKDDYCDKEVCITCASNTTNAGMYLKCHDGDCNYACSKINLTKDDFCDPEPPDPDKYCPKPYENVKITACLNNGGSYDKCISACSLKCPDDSDGKDPMSKTYRNCVFEKLGLGFELNDAKKMCYEKCEGKEGINVIYRTISLSNPFPSYNSDSTVTQSGLSVGMFNDTRKGRYPGANWNSSKLVKEKILNNRGVDGDEVYSLKPLYTFVLDNATIKRIRSYNNSNKYSDFKLNCKKQGIACVSSFVHNANYGLKNGTCAINLNSSNFYTCDD